MNPTPLNAVVLFVLLLIGFWILFAALGALFDRVIGWMDSPMIERRRRLWSDEERSEFRRNLIGPEEP